MPVAKGGSSQQQSGRESGATAGTQNQTTSGTATGTQYGTQTGTQTVDPTALWTQGSGNLGNLLGDSGLTADQQGVLGRAAGAAGTNQAGQNLDYANRLLGGYVGQPAHQTQAASVAQVGKTAAPTGSSFMDLYQNPFQDQVVNATAADLTQGLKTGLNEIRAGYGGALGNGREGVAAGGAIDDYVRTLGSTLGGLRSQGFNTALAGGQADAGRSLQALQGNQQADLQSALADAEFRQDAGKFNALAKFQNDQQSIGAINQFGQNSLAGDANARANNASVFDMSGGGVNQWLQSLGSQVPAFGASSAGTTGGGSTSSFENILSNIFSGTSSGTNSGSGSGKNGGISVG